MPVQCCAGTGRLACRAESGSSLEPWANVIHGVAAWCGRISSSRIRDVRRHSWQTVTGVWDQLPLSTMNANRPSRRRHDCVRCFPPGHQSGSTAPGSHGSPRSARVPTVVAIGHARQWSWQLQASHGVALQELNTNNHCMLTTLGFVYSAV